MAIIPVTGYGLLRLDDGTKVFGLGDGILVGIVNSRSLPRPSRPYGTVSVGARYGVTPDTEIEAFRFSLWEFSVYVSSEQLFGSHPPQSVIGGTWSVYYRPNAIGADVVVELLRE